MFPAEDPSAPGPLPKNIVLQIVDADADRKRKETIYQQCTVVQAAMTRRWHGIPAFNAKYLKQGRCPLPDSLGILQRHLWYRTCYLADGSEHEKPRQ